MKIRRWDRLHRFSKILGIFFGILFSVVIIILIQDEPGDIVDIGLFILLIFSATLVGICVTINNTIGRYLKLLKDWLDIDDLSTIIDLLPAQLEQLCIQKLKKLAEEIVSTEEQYFTMSKQCLDARQNLKNGYEFFKYHGFIKPTDWKHFFPPSDPKMYP